MKRLLEHIEVPFEVKATDDDTGTFEGYASVFGNEDLGGDVVEPGAFKRTLDHSGGAIPILWFHDPSQPIGCGIEAKEDGRGLFVKGRLDLGTQKGREVYSGLKMGYIGAMSIGYKAIGKNIVDGVRHLTELALPEYSLLTKGFAMNPEAATTGVKAQDFSTALATGQAEADLQDRRWAIDAAMREVMHDLKEDEALTDAQKVEALRASLMQYADALASWFADYLAVEATEDAAGMMAAAEDLQTKVGAVLSAANRAKVQAAVDALAALLEAADTPPKSADPTDAPGNDAGPLMDEAKAALALAEFALATA